MTGGGSVRAQAITPGDAVRIYLGFAFAYLLSYLLRMVNAVISPELSRDLGLSASTLGLLTAAYPIAFMAMQLPLGLAIDRFGPRIVESFLLLVATAGAALFAVSDDATGLLVARGLIGAGVSSCLMSALNGFQRWYPPERRPAMTGWIMVAAGVGAVFATTPVEWGLRFLGWRGVFFVLAGLTLAAALLVWTSVPASPRGASRESLAQQMVGIARVVASNRFWRIAPIMGINMGTFMAVQGLWSVPWMMEVDGLTRSAAAGVLLAMSAVMLCAFFTLGMFTERLARAGISHGLLFAVGMAVSGASFGLIAWDVGLPVWLVWALYGGGITVSSFSFNLLQQGVPLAMAGRATTALNLFIFLGSVVSQWGVGIAVDELGATGMPKGEALAGVFRALVVAHVLAYGWFLLGWRQVTGRATAVAAD
jgi:predicted MFS family arabinose efflux permease